MHGVMRVRTTEEEKARRDKERRAELDLFRTQMKQIFQKNASKEHDDEMLAMIGEVLYKNPDIGTLWNYRRNTLIHLLNGESDKDESTYYDAELRLTETCLRYNPKSYSAWHHRVWVLKTRKDPNWKTELKLCNASLKLDERNLHCWSYRDFVVASANVDIVDEFDYSLTKIEENFSNYSAWQYRSKLLTKLYFDSEEYNIIQEEKHNNELELVINAAFTDPNDSSAWFYQRWLLGGIKRKTAIAACRVGVEQTFVSFSQCINMLKNDMKIDFYLNKNLVDGRWKSVFNKQHDLLWIFEYTQKHDLKPEDNRCDVTLKYSTHDEVETVACDLTDENVYVGYGRISFDNKFKHSIIDTLKSHEDMCSQLFELEPECKWNLLTLAVIKNTLDRSNNYEECRDILNKLQVLDPKRRNYYKDLFTQWHIENCLENNLESVKEGKFLMNNQEVENIKLENVYYAQYWSVCRYIYLRGHNILSCNLPKLMMFQNCQVLDLGRNKMKSLAGFPSLPALETLYLDGTELDIDEYKYLKCCPSLRNIHVDQAACYALHDKYNSYTFIPDN